MDDDYLCFNVDKIRLGIPLRNIDRVISAVAVRLLPNSPAIIHGLIDFYGTLVPVINLRHRLNLEETAIKPDQVFVVVNTSVRKLILVADSVQGLVPLKTSGIIAATSIDEDLEPNDIYMTEEGIILIFDTEKFIKGEEILQFEIDMIQNQSDPPLRV